MGRSVEELDPVVREKVGKLVARCASFGLDLLITQTRRTFEEQQCLFDQGRTCPGKIVTNAKPGESAHNYGLAFDVAFKTPAGVTWEEPWEHAWQFVGEAGEQVGLVWGGRFRSFPDRPHFEFPRWKEYAAGLRPDAAIG